MKKPAIMGLGLTLFLLPALYGQTASTNLTVNGVHMLVPSDPAFHSTLVANFPTIANSSVMRTIGPMLVILINNDSVARRAYAVRWSVNFGDENGLTLDNVVFPRNRLDGDFDSLLPGEVRLLSPVFNYTPHIAAQIRNLSRLFDKQSFPVFPKATVSANLDAVIAEDDSVQGPDQTGLLLRYACSAKARADEGSEILTMLSQGASSDQVQTMLRGQAKPIVPVTGKEDARTFYSYALSEQAQAFLNAIQNRTDLRTRATAMQGSGGHAAQLCRD